jgi:tetratricopeptide (TPR) repeat protein
LFLCAAVALATTGTARAQSHAEEIAALFESSYLQEQAGTIEQAIADVTAILRLDPANYVANYRLGWLCYCKGTFADSIVYYTRAMTLAPGAIEAQLGLLLPLMAAQKWDDAETLGRKLAARAPDNYLAGSRLAYVYYMEGKYKLAEQQYQATLKNYPSELEMMLGLGWTYLKQGRSAEARDMFKKVLAVHRKNANALAGLKGL